MNAETRPDNNPKSAFGMAKPGISSIPPVALLHCGRGMDDGVVKYGLTNWRENSVSAGIYYNAAFRHLASWWDGEREASDSGVHHLGHVMACCAILLDAEAGGQLIDDRPAVPGKFSAMVKELTRELTTAAPESPRDYAKEELDALERAFGAADTPNVYAEMAEASGESFAEIKPGDYVLIGLDIGSGEVTVLETCDMTERDEGLCEDEGCDHHGTPHICVTATPEALAAIRERAESVPGFEYYEAQLPEATRPPVQKGGPLDPSGPKTAEIVNVVNEFTRNDNEGGKRTQHVIGWLDRNGYKSVGQIGSIRDQAALYDFIEAYIPGIG